MKILPAAALLFVVSSGALAADDLFDLKPVASGVYAAIAKPRPVLNCNAAVVVLDDGVLVVDTHSKPSAARALIAKIREVTDKPVRFVVNTHFHWDHYQGNEAYPSAWPAGIEIIASEMTREDILHRGIPRAKREILEVPKAIEKLKLDLANQTDAAQKARIEDEIRQRQSYLDELKSMRMALPSVTFDRSLVIHRPSRSVHILWLGKAHTSGDVVVYLPKDRVVATGDMLHGWMPYMGDSDPYEWPRTLDEVSKLDFDFVIGGHGDLMRGKEVFQLWSAYLRDLMREASIAYAEGATLAEMRTRVAAALRPTYGDKFGGRFASSVTGNIDKAYRVISASLE